jgi:uncharacterized protein YrrD
MSLTPHELRVGADVFSSDGHKLGELKRLILHRGDLRLTHIVIDIGFLRSGRPVWAGGFGLDYDRIVPVEAVSASTDDGIELALSAGEFSAAPEYTEEEYELPHDVTPGEFDIPDIANEAERWASALGSTPNIWLVPRLNKPLDAVDMPEGTDVWRREPHQKLGEVQRVILDQSTGAVRAFVIRRGFLLMRDVILPARYVAELLDGIVRVDITDEQIDQLRDYEDD